MAKTKEREKVVVEPTYSEEGKAALAEKHSTSHLISKRRHVALPQWATAWIVLIPAMIFLVFFMFYPIINTFFMAFIQDFEWVDGAGSFALGNFIDAVIHNIAYKRSGAFDFYKTIPSFGFDNFAKVLTDTYFLPSVLNTFILVIVEVPLTIIIALLLATFLNSIKALKGLYQTIFFLPYVTNAIALGLVFQMLFSSGQGGVINLLLRTFGLNPVGWLNKDKVTIDYGNGNIYTIEAASKFNQGIVIVVYAIWNGLAFKILVFMSGLATIDKQYSDAAKVDGASSITIWRRITLPLLSPQILYITITSFIGAFKMYTGVMSVYAGRGGNMSQYFGGIDGRTWEPVVGWIYRSLDAGSATEPGVAAAGSIVLLLIILTITGLQSIISKRRVHY